MGVVPKLWVLFPSIWVLHTKFMGPLQNMGVYVSNLCVTSKIWFSHTNLRMLYPKIWVLHCKIDGPFPKIWVLCTIFLDSLQKFRRFRPNLQAYIIDGLGDALLLLLVDGDFADAGRAADDHHVGVVVLLRDRRRARRRRGAATGGRRRAAAVHVGLHLQKALNMQI